MRVKVMATSVLKREPLERNVSLRVSNAHHETIVTRSVMEGVPQTELMRRWLRIGAQAEGLRF